MLKERKGYGSDGLRDRMAAYLMEARVGAGARRREGGEMKAAGRVATIPGRKRGPCQPVLVVFIGELDNCDVLLFESVEYLAARCRNVTKSVIFHAAFWSVFSAGIPGSPP
ncbi:MAG: hypothetical protein ABSG92_01845 [Conexivisphaerales archaeon]|jgi:hypothetical protein